MLTKVERRVLIAAASLYIATVVLSVVGTAITVSHFWL
jgi:hypothetical protein